MSSRPRVIAEHHEEGVQIGSLCGRLNQSTPTVNVDVAFDLHDHDAALAALDRAVAQVRAQIEETA